MKLGINQKTLLEALDRGALAALSEEAQADTSNISVLLKAVTIKANEKSVVFESATKLMAVRHTLPITKDSGIEVKETGEITVAAKDLYDWIKKQGESRIGLSYTPLAKPEIVTPVEEGKSDKNTIKKLGDVKIVSRDFTKTGIKWALDSYSTEPLPVSVFKPESKALFTAPTAQLEKGIQNIISATLKKDYEHVYDGVSFQQKSGKLYMITTDMARIATYAVTEAEDITLDEAPVGEEKPKDNFNVVINADLFQDFIKVCDPLGKVSVFYDSKSNKVFVEQTNTIARITASDRDKFNKIPPVTLVLNKKYEPLCGTDTKLLKVRLESLLMVNKEAVLFSFKKGVDQASIYAVSECGKSPMVTAIPVNDCKKDCKIVWNIQHIIDILGSIEDSETRFMVPLGVPDSVKICGKIDEKLIYVTMSVEKHKYDSSKAE